MRTLKERQVVLVPRAATFDLIASRTCLLEDYAVHKVLTGDSEAAVRMTRGEAGLMQLFERGTQDRKELEALVCAALRERGRLLLFTSAEVLIDRELIELLGEADRTEVTRRADAYLILEEGALTFDAYHTVEAAARPTFFKQAVRLGLMVGVSIKSDLGLRNRRSTSGELHLEQCPLVLLALPRIDVRTNAMSDVVVYAGAPMGRSMQICYVGGTPHNKLTNMAEVRYASEDGGGLWGTELTQDGHCVLCVCVCVCVCTRASLESIEAKLGADGWHALVQFTMGARPPVFGT